jgi:hypothetical protein
MGQSWAECSGARGGGLVEDIAVLTNVPVTLALAGGFVVTALVGIWRWRHELAETTLVPAWWWAMLAALAWGGSEIAAATSGSPGSSWLVPLRFAAVSLSFCPVIAVLGAKRPQHAAWSFVVASLWGILALPAAEAFFLQRGQRLEINAFRGWFLWILILLGPINYVPTRRWLAAVVLAAAQVLALAEHLPLVRGTWFSGQAVLALGLGSLVPWIGWFCSRSTQTAHTYDRLWLDFRDTFGLFWSLRLQERVNAVAQTNRWPLALLWTGIYDTQTGERLASVEPAIDPTLRTTITGLLRRFVSGRWIAQRLGRNID